MPEETYAAGLPITNGSRPRTRPALKFGRSRQIVPTKVAVSIRLSPQVVAHFRSGGPGWQSRIDELLRYYVAVSGRRSRLQQLLEAQRRVEAAQRPAAKRQR